MNIQHDSVKRVVLLLLADMFDADDYEAQAAIEVLRNRLNGRESVVVDDYGNVVVGLQPVGLTLTVER